jgi:hypothetical protein
MMLRYNLRIASYSNYNLRIASHSNYASPRTHPLTCHKFGSNTAGAASGVDSGAAAEQAGVL